MDPSTNRNTDTSKARALGPGADPYWFELVDPHSALELEERTRVAAAAKSAFYRRLGRRRHKVRRSPRAVA